MLTKIGRVLLTIAMAIGLFLCMVLALAFDACNKAVSLYEGWYDWRMDPARRGKVAIRQMSRGAW